MCVLRVFLLSRYANLSSNFLDVATETNLAHIMSWFPDADSLALWGGPAFRFPFTQKSFFADCCWPSMASYVLRNDQEQTLAFGQLYERLDRVHLARLAVGPDFRGQGIGKRLIAALCEEGAKKLNRDEFSLFVRKDNETAFRLYERLNFKCVEYPEDTPMREICHYMVRDGQDLVNSAT